MSSLTPFPIDYAAIRLAISQAMQSALGLSTNAVVMLKPDQPVAARPATPFATFQLTTSAQSFGRDTMQKVAGDQDTWLYSGPRMIACLFQFYGETHDQAFGMAATWLASLDQDPTLDILATGGLAIWRREQATEITAQLYTGYECRAALNCTFGVQSAMAVRVGSIAHVPVSGTLQAAGDSETLALTVDARD